MICIIGESEKETRWVLLTSLSTHCVGNSRKGVRGWKTWKIVIERCWENFLEKAAVDCLYVPVCACVCGGEFLHLDAYVIQGVFLC